MSENQWNLIKRIYSSDIIDGFKDFTGNNLKNIKQEDIEEIIEHKETGYAHFNLRFLSCLNYLKIFKGPLFSTNSMYNKKFEKMLNRHNWGGFSNRVEFIKAFETLNDLIYKYGMVIDLENREFYIGGN